MGLLKTGIRQKFCLVCYHIEYIFCYIIEKHARHVSTAAPNLCPSILSLFFWLLLPNMLIAIDPRGNACVVLLKKCLDVSPSSILTVEFDTQLIHNTMRDWRAISVTSHFTVERFCCFAKEIVDSLFSCNIAALAMFAESEVWCMYMWCGFCRSVSQSL